MPASDLFNSIDDASFRLRGTWLIIGLDYYYVRDVCKGEVHSYEADNALLLLDRQGKQPTFPVALSRLPLNTMFTAPTGYVDDLWVSRGPNRCRFQGLTIGSLWGYRSDYGLMTEFPYNMESLLEKLMRQPIRRKTTRSRILTRDVALTGRSGYVMVRGEIIGEPTTLKEVTLFPGVVREEVAPYLTNAKLKILN